MTRRAANSMMVRSYACRPCFDAYSLYRQYLSTRSYAQSARSYRIGTEQDTDRLPDGLIFLNFNSFFMYLPVSTLTHRNRGQLADMSSFGLTRYIRAYRIKFEPMVFSRGQGAENYT